ncbi:serine hydrolase domain-containing protein [Caulobacter mirabilis]|nr:serine hydrolase domain-containing protein [Caulobacter mirabilis]
MRLLLLGCVVGLSLSATAAVAADPDRQRRVETGLMGAAVFGDRPETWSLESRMAHWKVPGVSIAVVDDGKIVWAKGYGVLAAGEPAPVTARTRFQAASISKPVAAAGALSLVETGQLSLDGDVSKVLKTWTLPANPYTAERPLTLRDLLSHTGGTSQHGFPGYAQGAAVPTLTQLLDGKAPASNPAITFEARPGERWKYSGGGYEIAEQVMIDAAGKPFPDILAERVFKPAGMAASGYARPDMGAFALAHGRDGRTIPGGWHTYPEHAAAGLWTTPTDLARFGIALSRGWQGKAGGMLKPGTVKAMATEVKDGYGLGVGLQGEGEAFALIHGGANRGFKANWVIHPGSGDGVAVMTNGEAGDLLAREILRAVARTYDWPDYRPEVYQPHALPPDVLASRVGDWSVGEGDKRMVFPAKLVDGRLVFVTPRGEFGFVPIGPTTMVSVDLGIKAEFSKTEDGRDKARVFGETLTK